MYKETTNYRLRLRAPMVWQETSDANVIGPAAAPKIAVVNPKTSIPVLATRNPAFGSKREGRQSEVALPLAA